MDNDDRQIGRVLSRREFLALIGAAGAAALVGCANGEAGSTQPTQGAAAGPTAASASAAPTAASTLAAPTAAPVSGATQVASAPTTGVLPTCIVRPEQTEGPYFVDEKLERADIRSDPSDGSVKEGAPLQLAIRVAQISASGCTPLAGALVDIWHCDALGVYSDVADPGFSTIGKKFLRGYQVTDSQGIAQFTTIYPGWYQGRTVHIHFKIRTEPASGQGYEFTSQLYFDDSVTDQAHQQAPYASKGVRTVRNEGDGIFRDNGDQLMLALAEAGQGYTATFDIGLQMT